MKIKIFHLVLIGLSMIAGVCSCVNLDLPSDGRVTLNEIFSNYSRTKSYCATCRSYIAQVGFKYGNTPLASFCDEAQDASDGMNSSINDWYNGRTSAFTNPLIADYIDPWDHYFEGIRKCNTFLSCMTNPAMEIYDFDETDKNGMLAEVRVVRAYCYLQLIKRYGGVPLIETPYEISHDFTQSRRASFEECTDFILADCDWALAVKEFEGQPIGFRWSIDDTERGVITRAFAYAVKSQTALYAASPLWNNGNGKYTWEQAATITKEALNQCLAHGFRLYAEPVAADVAQNAYAYYFFTRSDPSRSWDKETIYESTSENMPVWRYAGTPISTGMEKAGPCPSQELVDSYEMADGTQPILGYSDASHLQPILNPASSYDPSRPYENRDPRFYASIYYNGAIRYLDRPEDVKVETFAGGNCGISDRVTDTRFTRTGYYLRKFNNFKSDATLNADGYMRIFRLSELYLNFAEAAYQAYGADAAVTSSAGNSPATAREAVNAVRARAGMPPLPEGLSKSDFEKRYRNERRVELAFEEHRFFDVRRWKILNETDGFVTGMRITREEDNFIYSRIKLANRGTSADKYLMYPVRQDEVAKMLRFTGTNWQNPDW
ncbi:MAG: RagB/SusD family nutrient uptake outer membrane protein [Tannerella sp.]|jgi:hypothetical protein|nr:RagB/SusD family nutrient uptake outer membrane protein [Tannerella sp.]